jgi:Vanadium chloroperoxidase N-terminal domain/PAP2 superfamily
MDAILFWNDIALQAVANDFSPAPPDNKVAPEQGGPTRTARALAIVHLAMYDAFNSIATAFSPYVTSKGGILPLPKPGASRRAAIGEAAAVTLIALYPRQTQLFQQASQTFLAGLNASPQSIENGRDQGRGVADAVLKLRQNDGSNNNLPYVPSQNAGKHRVDPLNPDQGFLTPNWGAVAPFGNPVVLAAPPPALNSSQYAIDFNEVKGKGVLTGGTRTPEETTIGLFWAYDGAQKIGVPPRLYNQFVVKIAIEKGNTLAQNARLLALVNMAMADAGIQCWLSKYEYEIWRPVLGIREADAGWGPTGQGDGNPGTQGDPYWLPLGAPRTNEPGEPSFTPGFPAYPSGHATFGAASLDMVRLFYGSDTLPPGFTFVSDELDGKSIDRDGSIRTRLARPFSTLSGAIQENGDSRVYLGVHWCFDSKEGIKSGKQIAQDIFNHFLKP